MNYKSLQIYKIITFIELNSTVFERRDCQFMKINKMCNASYLKNRPKSIVFISFDTYAHWPCSFMKQTMIHVKSHVPIKDEIRVELGWP